MAHAKHNLWKRRKNKPDKLVRSHKEWKKRAAHSKVRHALELAENRRIYEKELNTAKNEK